MAINIKELFVTDLDPNSGAWWSKDKVDKINYNFYLLSNGGMPGPQGTIGVDGGFGLEGPQGDIGFQGSQGFQGMQGLGSLNDWDYFPEDTGLPGYLFPRKNPINITQSAPVALRIGYLSASADPEYFIGADPQAPVQIVKTINSAWVNLRVEDNEDINGYNFSFKQDTSKPIFEISPDITSTLIPFKIINAAESIVFKTFIPGTFPSAFKDSIIITDSLITINTGGITGPKFNLSNATSKFTKSLDEFRFTPGAAKDKVLVSTGTDGNIEWKNIKDVFGTFPIGSIVSIREDEFIDAHFWLNDSINVALGFPLNNIYGRGKVGTDYEGWYLCNGETWETEQGFNQFLTPNLNNFSYTISANGDAQILTNAPESDPILIGGYDMKILAVPNSNGIYSINYEYGFPDNNTSPGNSIISMGTSATHYTSRMIHIVYLEDTTLKWSNNGVYVPPPPTTNEITLTLPLTTPLGIATKCFAAVTTNYSWNGTDNNDWNTFAVPSGTYKLFNSGTTNFAPAGWYVNIDGYPIYWNGTDFTQRGVTCNSGSTLKVPNFKYSLIVSDLNGTINFGSGDMYLDTDAPLFINATTLKWSDDQLVHPVGSNADAGWYRDIVTGVRRYWSGSSFQGVPFTEDWVERVTVDYDGITNPGYNNATTYVGVFDPMQPYPNSICDLNQDHHLTYVVGNTNLTVPIISLTQHIKNYDSALYVTVGWVPPLVDSFSGDILNTPPLINIKNQPKPGSTLKYSKVYIDTTTPNGYDYGTIVSTNGKIGVVSPC